MVVAGKGVPMGRTFGVTIASDRACETPNSSGPFCAAAVFNLSLSTMQDHRQSTLGVYRNVLDRPNFVLGINLQPE
jgi:hypothetical protein